MPTRTLATTGLTGTVGAIDRRLTVHTTTVILFWTSFAGLCLSYLGYPLLVYCLARRRPRAGPPPADLAPADWPELTVLIAAHNAQQHIGQRIRNILACDYPRDRLRIVVASDGSTDATVPEVQRFDPAQVQAIAFRRRRGKATTLADAVRQLRSEVVVFTDASSRFDRRSLRQLARHFADPRIGLVAGTVTIVDEEGQPRESLYWRSEMMVRRSEAQLGIMLGASGAIYAMRRQLFEEPACPLINDDLVFSLLTHLRHACGFVFDDSACAYALSTGGLASEFRRRSRIGAGAFQCLPHLGELFQWRHAKQALAFGAHKLLRWTCPFLLVALVVTNLALASAWPYRLLLHGQAAAYALALFGLLAPRSGRLARIAHAAATFLVMNLALLVGFFRWVCAPHNVVWNPTPRPTYETPAPVLRNL